MEFLGKTLFLTVSVCGSGSFYVNFVVDSIHAMHGVPQSIPFMSPFVKHLYPKFFRIM